MDLAKIIKDLSDEKSRMEAAIAMLEDLQRTSVTVPDLPNSKRRGRKAMPLEERQEVSERMKRYWAKRREQRGVATVA